LNLIFDLGGVVVRWDPAAIIASVFDDEELQAKVRDGVFAHADWLELDRGTLDREDAIRRAAQRIGMTEGEIRRLLLAVPPSLVPIPETIDLLYRLKAQGHPLYCLSNMHVASIEHLEREHEFFEVFTGKVISCRLKLCKPEAAIYEQALALNKLKANESVFIDDVDVNIEAAAKVGLHTVQFQNAAQCERELRALGVSL
jgi:putative hydrolase of the HAD superfamily